MRLFHRRAAAHAGLILLLTATSVAAVDMRVIPGERLAPLAPREPVELARDFVGSHLSGLGLAPGDADDVIVQSEHVSSTDGVTHVYLRQRHLGIEVFDGNLYLHVHPDGRLEPVKTSFVSGLAAKAATATPVLTAAEAVRAVAAQVGVAVPDSLQVASAPGGPDLDTRFDGEGFAASDVRARLVYVRDEREVLRLAWDVTLETPSSDHWWSVRVDALDGSVIETHDWVANATYRVFEAPAESPNHVMPLPPADGRRLVVNPEDAVASPTGWVAAACTEGPNVRAVEDTAGNNNATNTTCGGSPFDFALNWAQQPATGTNQDAAVVNLFYWNNVLHDVLRYRGFDRGAGNFEGNANRVFADAQDGSGRNNANFGTPPNGANPRMQMFLWDPAPRQLVFVQTPSMAGYVAQTAGWPPAPPAAPRPNVGFVLANDGTGTTSDACEPLVNAAAIQGNIAVIDRGMCTFVVKAAAAEAAGAIAVVMVNNQPGGGVITMGGTPAPPATIPSVMISFEDGAALKAMLPGATGRVETPGGAAVDIDGDYDAGVIAHEYGHGVSNRLVGGPANTSCLQNCEQMGEGWSDLLGLMMTARPTDTGPQRRGIGTYVVGQATNGVGIRQFPYSTDTTISGYEHADVNALTCPGSQHAIGSVWASIVWEVYWAFTARDGFSADLKQTPPTAGNVKVLQWMLDGMKRTTCGPTFCAGRDGILESIQAGCSAANPASPNADCCLAWTAFAKRGLGSDSSCGTGSSVADNRNGFAVPATCSAPACTASAAATVTGSASLCPGDTTTLDAGSSTVTGCAGTTRYQWFVDGAPIAGATGRTYTTPSSLPERPAPYVYDVSVTCSTDPACTSRLGSPINVTVSGPSVVDTLKAAKRSDDVDLEWAAVTGAAGGYHVYRADDDKTLVPVSRGPVPPAGVTLAVATPAGAGNNRGTDPGAVPPPPANPALYFYQVLSVCANGTSEGPN